MNIVLLEAVYFNFIDFDTLFGTGLENPSLFDLKIVYSYEIEVADSESDFGLHGKALVSEIFAFCHLKNAL